MITVGSMCRGVHHKSEISDQPVSDSRRLTIEWTADL